MTPKEREYYGLTNSHDELAHSGRKGMKWGKHKFMKLVNGKWVSTEMLSDIQKRAQQAKNQGQQLYNNAKPHVQDAGKRAYDAGQRAYTTAKPKVQNAARQASATANQMREDAPHNIRKAKIRVNSAYQDLKRSTPAAKRAAAQREAQRQSDLDRSKRNIADRQQIANNKATARAAQRNSKRIEEGRENTKRAQQAIYKRQHENALKDRANKQIKSDIQANQKQRQMQNYQNSYRKNSRMDYAMNDKAFNPDSNDYEKTVRDAKNAYNKTKKTLNPKNIAENSGYYIEKANQAAVDFNKKLTDLPEDTRNRGKKFLDDNRKAREERDAKNRAERDKFFRDTADAFNEGKKKQQEERAKREADAKKQVEKTKKEINNYFDEVRKSYESGKKRAKKKK